MAQKATIDAINTMVVGLKADGVWDKITEAYLMAGVTFGGITVKLKGTGSLTNNNFVSGDYQATGSGAGLTGDGSSKYLGTGLVPTYTSLGDRSFSIYITGSSKATAGTANVEWFGSETGAVEESLSYLTTARPLVRYPIETGSNQYPGKAEDQHFILSRRGLSELEVYANGVSIGTDTDPASTPLGSQPYAIFANNNDGTPNSHSDGTAVFAHIGTGLTDTDASNLSNRVNTLMTSLGCNVY